MQFISKEVNKQFYLNIGNFVGTVVDQNRSTEISWSTTLDHSKIIVSALCIFFSSWYGMHSRDIAIF